MFRHNHTYTCVSGIVQHFQDMLPEVQLLFPQVKELIILLLVCPASSCSAERSFSSLRRLKTWLRSTMSQRRLNAVAVCNTHQDILDDIDITAIAVEFVSRSDIRRNMFGNFL